MLFLGIFAISIFTAIMPFWLPKILDAYVKVKVQLANKLLPVLAGMCFYIAWYIPNIHISEQTTTFQQHFVGGGLYCALLFVYITQLLNWRFSKLLSMVVLFAWVSAFGVANELLEFTLTQLGLANISTGDTSWDLLANTSGAIIGFVIYKSVVRAANKYGLTPYV